MLDAHLNTSGRNALDQLFDVLAVVGKGPHDNSLEGMGFRTLHLTRFKLAKSVGLTPPRPHFFNGAV